MTVRRKRAPVPKIQEVTEEVGRVYKTNNCGDVVVVEYLTTKNITIKFVDTGNTYKTVKDPLEKGLIKDSIEILRAAFERQDKIKQERLLRKNLLVEKSLAIEKEKQEKALQREKEKEAWLLGAEERNIARREKQKLDKLNSYKELIGQMYSHPYFGDYEITGAGYDCDKLKVKIKFSVSGNEYYAVKGVAQKGSVHDKLRYDEEGWKVHQTLNSSMYYQQNRESSLAQAKQWQKDNPDKCRVRNQNRRAKRFELGGEVTLEELNALMEEQDYKCANCKDELTDDNKHMDHIMPIVLKGTGDIKNIQWLCDYCNLSKNDKHPDLWAKVVATKEWWDIKELRQKGAKNQDV